LEGLHPPCDFSQLLCDFVELGLHHFHLAEGVGEVPADGGDVAIETAAEGGGRGGVVGGDTGDQSLPEVGRDLSGEVALKAGALENVTDAVI